MSVILNSVISTAEEITHFLDQVNKSILISQLINGISRVLQKLPKSFNSTTISTYFVLSLSRVFPVILTIDDLDSVILSFDLSL